MTTRIWDGGTARFYVPAAWTPAGRPVPGDSLDIVGGTAEVGRRFLRGLSIQLGGAPIGAPPTAEPATLRLHHSVIAADTTISVGGRSVAQASVGRPSATIEASSENQNRGTISVASFSPPGGGFPTPAQLTIDLTGRPTAFNNTGTLESGDTPSTLMVEARSRNSVLVNNGVIEAGSTVDLDLNVLGLGKMQFGDPFFTGPSPHAIAGPSIDTTAAVGFGQTVEFQAASGVDSHGKLSIKDPADFHALIRDFVSSTIESSITPLLHQDLIALNLPNLTSADYQGTTAGGVLSLTAGNAVAHLRFAGNYSLASFQITSSGTETDVSIKP